MNIKIVKAEDNFVKQYGTGNGVYKNFPINLKQSKEFIYKDMISYLDTLTDFNEIDKRLKDRFYVFDGYTTLQEVKDGINRIYEEQLIRNAEHKKWFEAEKKKFENLKAEKIADNLRQDIEYKNWLETTNFIECSRCSKPTPECDEVKDKIRFCLSCEMERSDLMRYTRKTFDMKILDPFIEHQVKKWTTGIYGINVKEFLYEFLLDRIEYPSVNTICNVLKQYRDELEFIIPEDKENLLIRVI
jgi:hypothetical protein